MQGDNFGGKRGAGQALIGLGDQLIHRQQGRGRANGGAGRIDLGELRTGSQQQGKEERARHGQSIARAPMVFNARLRARVVFNAPV